MKMDKKWLGAALVLLVICVPLAVKKSRGETAVQVDFATASEQEIRPTILASGTLAFRNEVNLTAEVVARVSMIAVREGDTVVQGQLLMKLDPEIYRNAIEQEEASQRQASINLQRQRAALTLQQEQFERSTKLFAAKLIAQGSFDESRNQLELAQADLKASDEALRRADAVLDQAREQLTKTEIRSPIDGTIVEVPIKVGETAIPSTSSLAGAQLIRIADTSTIQADMKVDEADIARVVIGQQADVYAAAYPDTALKGTVQRIALAPSIEGLGRAYKVTVLLNVPRSIALRSGMSARADMFLNDGKKRLAVPVEAVGTDVGEDKKVTNYVWLQKEGKASKVVVEIGVSDDRWEEIGKPLAKGDIVIIGPAKALRLLHEGDHVSQRPKKDKEEEASDNDTQRAKK